MYLWPWVYSMKCARCAPLHNIYPHYVINDTNFEKNIYIFIENKKSAFRFSLKLVSETFFFLRKNKSDRIKNASLSSCKVTVILFHCDENLIFLTEFRKMLKYQIQWKSIQWEPSCLMGTERQLDGRTDKTKLLVAFRKSANAHKWH